jgi:hypothetical protein
LWGDRGKINASASECHAAGFSNVRSKLSSQHSAGDLASLLNGLFSEFDRLARAGDQESIEELQAEW